ncbi:hypothetical protein D3C86_1716500 [compost metagenome]
MEIDHARHIEKRQLGNPPGLRPLHEALQGGLNRRCQQIGSQKQRLAANIGVIVLLYESGQFAGVGLLQQQLTDIQQPS